MYLFLKFSITNLYLLLWLLSAFVLFWKTKGQPKLRFKIVLVLVVLWIIAIRPVAELALYPLERAYEIPDIDSLRNSEAIDVVILGGGAYEPEGEQIYSQLLSESSTIRFLNGLELCSILGPEYRIIHSGGGLKDNKTAEFQDKLTSILQPDRITIMEIDSKRTIDHPTYVGKLLENDTFIMVTSASHIVRSVRVFRKAGYNPIPFPVGRLFPSPYGFTDFFPSTNNLRKLEIALYEYFALILYSFE